MILSNCPRCEETVRLPGVPFPDDAYAQCPWCQETYPLAEVLHRLPPVLQVMTSDGQPLEPSPQPAAVVGSSASGGPESKDLYDSQLVAPDDDAMRTHSDQENKTVAEETVEDTLRTDSFDFDSSQSGDFDIEDPNDTLEIPPASNQAGVAPMKVTPAPVAARRKKSSPIRTALSIVLGALAAGPLAIGILWVLTWFGVDVNLGFWPLDGNTAVASQDRVAAKPAMPSPQPTDHSDVSAPAGRTLVDSAESDDGSDELPDSSTPQSSDLAADDNPPTGEDLRNAGQEMDVSGSELKADLAANADLESNATEPDDPLRDVLPTEESSEPGASQRPDSSAAEVSSDPGTSLQMPIDGDQDLADLNASLRSNPTGDGPGRTTPKLADASSSDADSATSSDSPDPISAAVPSEPSPVPTEALAGNKRQPKNPQPKQPQPEKNVQVEPTAVTAAVDTAIRAIEAVNDESDPSKKQLAQCFATIANVGVIADRETESVRTLLQATTRSAGFPVWNESVGAWLKYGSRPTEGTIVVGERNAQGNFVLSGNGNKQVRLSEDSLKPPQSEQVVGIGRIVSTDPQPTVKLIAVEPLP